MLQCFAADITSAGPSSSPSFVIYICRLTGQRGLMRFPLFCFLAIVPCVALSLPPRHEPLEDCASTQDVPVWYDRFINKRKVVAYEKVQQCLQQNREREKRNIERQTAELEGIVSRSHESCRQAVRRLVPQPATLSFDYTKPFSYLAGLNGSGVNTTDGGYSVEVSGSDIQGRFSIKCYMSKQFNVTTLR
ncbi:MAG: hypothetical protein B7Y03_09150 [Polaromonas sp. 24-62-144]|nr:MAG: hypothetical protein B7Y03_09150 [Polaromonas sp. 24-62-144]